MFAPGVIGSFNGGFTAATPQLGDFAGSFPDYKVYASGSTTDGVAKSLTFGVSDNPTGLAVPNDTTWMFTTSEFGDPSEDEIFQFQGSFADAKKAAAKWAKSQGEYRFYVME